MTDNFDFARYRKRVLVETKFSVLKRRFGADLKSRSFQIQKKEISCKIILANLDRFILFVWIEVFYRAKILNQDLIDPDQNFDRHHDRDTKFFTGVD